MYVLSLGFRPIAVAERRELLNDHIATARYTAEQQASMHISDEVELLQ